MLAARGQHATPSALNRIPAGLPCSSADCFIDSRSLAYWTSLARRHAHARCRSSCFVTRYRVARKTREKFRVVSYCRHRKRNCMTCANNLPLGFHFLVKPIKWTAWAYPRGKGFMPPNYHALYLKETGQQVPQVPNRVTI